MGLSILPPAIKSSSQNSTSKKRLTILDRILIASLRIKNSNQIHPKLTKSSVKPKTASIKSSNSAAWKLTARAQSAAKANKATMKTPNLKNNTTRLKIKRKVPTKLIYLKPPQLKTTSTTFSNKWINLLTRRIILTTSSTIWPFRAQLHNQRRSKLFHKRKTWSNSTKRWIPAWTSWTP